MFFWQPTMCQHKCELKQNQHQEPYGFWWNQFQLVEHMYLDWTELYLVLMDHKIPPDQPPLNVLDPCSSQTQPFLESIPVNAHSITSNYNMGCLIICKMPDRERQTWSLSPEGSDVQRGSFISSQAKMVGSSLYVTFVNEFTLLSTVFVVYMGINNMSFSC